MKKVMIIKGDSKLILDASFVGISKGNLRVVTTKGDVRNFCFDYIDEFYVFR